tara:strand:+ start:731 stop:1021 length:291 start_codon:yes stop_codon:yes gene_type:complete
MAQALDVLDAHLAARGQEWLARHPDSHASSHPSAANAFLAGDAFTLADLAFMPYLEALCAARCDDLIEARPCLCAWWGRCRARDTWQGVVGMAKKK